MIIKYSEGNINSILDKEELDEEELNEKLDDALEPDSEQDLTKEASQKKVPFWIKDI